MTKTKPIPGDRRALGATRSVSILLAVSATYLGAAGQDDIDRYLQRAEREVRMGDYDAGATTLDLVLALYSLDSAEPPAALFLRHAQIAHQAGRHEVAAESATRYLLASDRPAQHDERAIDLVKSAEQAIAHERNVNRAPVAPEQPQIEVWTPREGDAPVGGKGPQTCEVPGFPAPEDVQSLGLSWCSSSVDFELRVFALQAAGGWCAIRLGTSSTTEQIEARHDQIVAGCDRLEAFGGYNDGPSCRCPPGYRP